MRRAFGGVVSIFLLFSVTLAAEWVSLTSEMDQFQVQSDSFLSMITVAEPTTRILVAVVHWNGGVPVVVQDHILQLSIHPNVRSFVRSSLSSIHRGRNILFQTLLRQPGSLDPYSHILLLNQDVILSVDDLDRLIAAKKDIIAGLVVQRHPPFEPSLITVDGRGEDGQWSWLYDLSEPFKVHASGLDVVLFKVSLLQKTLTVYGDKLEWFWLPDDLLAPSRIELEDVHFSRTLATRQYELFVHPLVRPRRFTMLTMGPSLLVAPPAVQRQVEGLLVANGKPTVVVNKFKSKDKLTISKSTRVVIASPAWQQYNPVTADRIWDLVASPLVVGLVTVSHQVIVNARNTLIETIFEEFGENFTHVLNVDADMTFVLEDMHSLIECDLEMVMGVAVKRALDDYPPAFIPLGKNPLVFPELLQSLAVTGRKPPVPIKAGGMAFTLVKRKIYDIVRRVSSEGKYEWFWCEHVTDEETGLKLHLSEDYTFCANVRRAGYQVYVDPNVQLGHIDDREGKLDDFLKAQGYQFSRAGDTPVRTSLDT